MTWSCDQQRAAFRQFLKKAECPDPTTLRTLPRRQLYAGFDPVHILGMIHRFLLTMITIMTATGFASAAVGSQPQLATALPLANSSWAVEAGEQECHLARQFQSASGTFWLDIVRGGGPEQLDMLLVGKGVPKVRAGYYFWIGVASEGEPRFVSGVSGTVNKTPGRMLYVRDVPSRMIGGLTGARTLTLSAAGIPLLALNLPEAKEAFADLQDCYRKLLTAWHVDFSRLALPLPLQTEGSLSDYGNPGTITAQRSDLPKVPVDPNAWVQYADYPSEALRREVGGTVVVALTVDPSGKATHCDVVVSSKLSALDETTCNRMLARARYQPLEQAGSGTYLRRAVERVRWIIPVPLR